MTRAGETKGEVEEWSEHLTIKGPQPPKTNVHSAHGSSGVSPGMER